MNRQSATADVPSPNENWLGVERHWRAPSAAAKAFSTPPSLRYTRWPSVAGTS